MICNGGWGPTQEPISQNLDHVFSAFYVLSHYIELKETDLSNLVKSCSHLEGSQGLQEIEKYSSNFCAALPLAVQAQYSNFIIL